MYVCKVFVAQKKETKNQSFFLYNSLRNSSLNCDQGAAHSIFLMSLMKFAQCNQIWPE